MIAARCCRLRAGPQRWDQCGAPATFIAQGPNPPREVAPTAFDQHGVTALERDRPIHLGDELAMEWPSCLPCSPTSAWPLVAWHRAHGLPTTPPRDLPGLVGALRRGDPLGIAEVVGLAITQRLEAA